MNLFFWKKNQQVDAFARALADDLYSRITPEVADRYFAGDHGEAGANKVIKGRSVSKKDVEKRIKDAVLKVQQFKSEQSLGIYRKARFHLVFTERLKELGFSHDVADEINKTILLQTP